MIGQPGDQPADAIYTDEGNVKHTFLRADVHSLCQAPNAFLAELTPDGSERKLTSDDPRVLRFDSAGRLISEAAMFARKRRQRPLGSGRSRSSGGQTSAFYRSASAVHILAALTSTDADRPHDLTIFEDDEAAGNNEKASAQSRVHAPFGPTGLGDRLPVTSGCH